MPGSEEAGQDNRVRLRDAQSLAVIRGFRAHGGPVTQITWKFARLVDGSGQGLGTRGSLYAISGEMVVPRVPDSGTTLAMLGLALTGLAGFRRSLALV